jgi:ferredoxin-NADP reductase/MOSC domain-containing protein YiiM
VTSAYISGRKRADAARLRTFSTERETTVNRDQELVMKVLQVNAGPLKPLVVQGDTMPTGFYKEARPGPVKVHSMGLEGDARVYAAGDPNRAVLFYQAHYYDYWRTELKREIPNGMFGENITFEGWDNEDFCIGDELQIGTVRLRITQSRHPCIKLGARMGDPGFPIKFLKSLKLGFHCSVLEEGTLAAGDQIKLVYRAASPLHLQDFAIPTALEPNNLAGLERILACPELIPQLRIRVERLWRKSAGRLDGWREYRPLKIRNISHECEDVASFDLESANGEELSKFDGGQFLTIQLNIPGKQRPVVRTYTIAGRSESGNGYTLAVKREWHEDGTLGVASSYLLDKTKVGDIINALPPRGNFTVEPCSRPIALLSAGIGVTPTLAMFEQLKTSPLHRDVYFLHGARRGDQHICGAKVRKIAADWAEAHLFVKYSQPTAVDLDNAEMHGCGHITIEDVARVLPSLDADYYICGPVSFMRDLVRGLVARGVLKERIKYEFFGTGEPLFEEEAVPPGEPIMDAEGKPIVVTFARAGISVPWTDSAPSILVLAERNGIKPAQSCRNGLCEVCVCRLDSGQVRYNGDIINPPGEGEVMICCATPTTSVMVDA